MSRVALWAEAGPAIGLGHFMRCRTLAQALLARGHSPVFVLDDASAAAVGGMIPEGAARLRVDQGARFAAGHPAPDAMILD